MARRLARDIAMQILFAYSLSGEYSDETIKDSAKNIRLSDDDWAYIHRVVNGTIEQSDQLDALINEIAVGWRTDRMAKVDLSLLRLSLYEIIHCDDIPVSVSINEVVELAKQYGSDDSGSFINGILSTYSKNHIKDDAVKHL